MQSSAYRFRDFLLDPAARELARDGIRINLPPKSFDCLTYLVRHRERAVGRDELISAVWGRVDVSDALLAQTLLRARRAVGDTGNEQTAIRTVPRFGYRWVAPTEVVMDSASPDAGGPTPVVAPPPAPTHAVTPPVRRRGSVTALLLAGALAMLAVWVWSRQAHSPNVAIAPGLAVVAPVRLAAGEADASWMRLGGMDFIASRLRAEGRLPVLPSDRVAALVGDDGDAPSMRARLLAIARPAVLVEPQARREGSRWHMRLEVWRNGKASVVEGLGDSPLAAAERATDALLAQLGHSATARRGGDPEPVGSLEEALHRIDAALLAGNLAAVREIIATMTPAWRDDPRVRVREAREMFRGGRVDEAESLYARLESRLDQLAPDIQAETLMGRGAVAVRRADYEAAEKRYAEALAALGANGTPDLLGAAYRGRGVARAARAQFDFALGDFSRARIALARAGDEPGVAIVDANLGLLESRRGQWSASLQAFERAIAVFDRFDIRDNLAASLLGKARAESATLDDASALESSSRALDLARELENPVLRGSIVARRGEILLDVGALSEAASLLAAHTAAVGPGADVLRARLALERGDAEAALHQLRSDPASRDDPDRMLIRIDALVAAHRLAASDCAAIPTGEGTAAPTDGRLPLSIARATCDSATGAVEAAREAFEEGLALPVAEGTPRQRTRLIVRYLEFLIAQGTLDRASELAGRLAGQVDRDYGAARALAQLHGALGDTAQQAAAETRARALAGERAR